MGLKKVLSVLLAAAMLFSLTACGGKGNENPQGESGSGQGGEESVSYGIDGYVYVAQYEPLGNGGYPQNIVVKGNSLYYSEYGWDEETYESWENFYRLDLSAPDAEPEKIDLQYDTNMSISSLLADAEGNLYMAFQDYSAERQTADGYARPDYYVGKYSPQGEELFLKDITSQIGGEEYTYIDSMEADSEGNLYIATDSQIYLFDGTGEPQGQIDPGGYVNGFGSGKDGKVYCSFYGDNGPELHLVDFQGKKLGEAMKNLPNDNGNNLVPGFEKDFLLYDSNSVYEYDCASQSYETLLNWLDSDIYGDNVRGIAPLEDGRLLALTYGYSDSGSSMEMAYLTKTEISAVEQKQIVTVGSLYPDPDLQSLAVSFNKKNSAYHVTIKNYFDYDDVTGDNYMEVYSAAMTNMNNDIVSGKGADLYDFNSFEGSLANYVSKGAIEDLTPYLEKSTKVSKDDYVDSVINAYTFDGLLACIPVSFTISTVVGRTSQVGEEMGWSMEDMMALMDANPDAVPFQYTQQTEMLQVCLAFNQSAFMNLETGECHFDSDEFKTVLEFVNHFPAEDIDYDGVSEYKKIKDGKVLLSQVDFYDIDSITGPPQLFDNEPITYVGFPTMDGSVGCVLRPGGGCYAISAASAHKDAAWEFVESVLVFGTDLGSRRYFWGFNSNKEVLEQDLAAETADPYEKDENGNILLDENGNPQRRSNGWSESGDGYREYSYVPLPEEVEQLRQLIEVARPLAASDEEITNMILEDAAPYFAGQKSVDDVADIIQSRVSIYISENY